MCRVNESHSTDVRPRLVLDSGRLTLLQRDGAFAHVSAQQVLDALTDPGSERLGLQVAPSVSCPGLTFMTRPLTVIVHALLQEEILVHAAVSHRGQVVDLPVPYDDHVVVGSTWYPLDTETYESVTRWLGTCVPFGRLELGAVVTLYSALAAGLTLKDDFDIEALRTRLDQVSQPAGIAATLYEYQLEGLRWLAAITDARAGGILADEMGLGKTLQVIALLEGRRGKSANHPSLVVVPATVVANWVRELSRFAPDLKVHVHQGPNRVRYFIPLLPFDVVVTTYDTVVADEAMLQMIAWDIVIADEAQAIKNPDTRRAGALKSLIRHSSVAVTGTPLENRALDLWSLADFALPNFLGSREHFTRYLETRPNELERSARALILRREVRDVAKDLPERVDIDEELDMLGPEADLYEALRNSAQDGLSTDPPLAMITRLRQFTAHPSLISDGPASQPLLESAKFFRLYELLGELLESGKKALVFCAFLGASDLISWMVQDRLNGRAWVLDGRVAVTDRQLLVDEFSDWAGGAVLIANPIVGGTGLNITAAAHVVHYTLEWNPAKEDQATARAYRRGQEKTVFVHRLYYRGTIDEALVARLRTKRDLFEAVVQPTDAVTRDELLRILQLSPLGRPGSQVRQY